MSYYVYILASRKGGIFYIGVTRDLVIRVYEHRTKVADGFTANYNVNNLVYYELHEDINAAIAREKAIKKWKRIWKIEMIEKFNPDWKDLYSEII